MHLYHQQEWVVQMEHALECYNIVVEDEEDPRNIDIPERRVQGPELQLPDMVKPLKVKKMSILE